MVGIWSGPAGEGMSNMAENRSPRVALVTGGNQGLGRALAATLADRLEPGDVVYLGARDPDKGRAAAETLGPRRARVEVAQIDVTDTGSIGALAQMLADRHGGIDLVASNAAARIVREVPQAEQVRRFVATNNHGSRALRSLGAASSQERALRLCRQFIRPAAQLARGIAGPVRHRYPHLGPDRNGDGGLRRGCRTRRGTGGGLA